MYFILKVKVTPNLKHKFVKERESLEAAIEAVKEESEKYVVKKNKHNFDETEKPNVEEFDDKTVRSVKFVKKFNDKNNNIVEIYKRVERSIKGWVGSSRETDDELVAYFCYVKHNFVKPDFTCDRCQMQVAITKRAPVFGNGPSKNPELITALRKNKIFQDAKKNIEYNDMQKEEIENEFEMIVNSL